MAESTSFFPNLGLLSEQSLLGLDPAAVDALQRDATKRIAIGTLLGRPDVGFSSAMSLPSDYAQNQARLLDLTEKQRAQQAEEEWGAKYNPTKYQETSPEYVGPVSPDVSAYQSNIAKARAAGMPTSDVNAALRDLTMIRTPRQAQMLEAFKASLPKVGEGGTMTAPSGQYLGTLPQFSPSQNMLYGALPDPSGRITPFAQQIPGGAAIRAQNVTAETQARELSTPRPVPGASGGTTFIYPPPPTGVSGGVGGGAERQQTAGDVALQKAASERFTAMSNQATTAAQAAAARRQSSESIYNLAESLDPNKFKEWVSNATPYLRALPGIGDRLDQFATDATLLNQEYSKNLLTQFASGAAKGNLNPQEVTIFQKSVGAFSDPKAATKWNAALGIAGADKDEAKMSFLESYTGDPAKFNTAWVNSPDNIKIYNHPKVEQFLNEQVSQWYAKQNKSADEQQKGPTMPPGFQFGSNKAGEMLIKKPDGSIMKLGQGR